MKRNLAFVAVLACAGLLTALLPAPVWLRALLLTPFVLIMPGYALAANFFAPNTVGASERAVYAVALSIAVTAIGGLLTQLLFGLGREAWAVGLFLVTVGATGRVLLTRPLPAPRPWRVPWTLAPACLAFVLAAVIAGAAIISASDGLQDAQAKIRFTDFWLLPGAGASTDTVRVGVRSHEGAATAYTLRLYRNRAPISTRVLRLQPGDRWERSLTIGSGPRSTPVTAILNREGEPYRRLDVTPPR
jgi:uncharacterized membrane protein